MQADRLNSSGSASKFNSQVDGKRSRCDELVTMSYSMKQKREMWKEDGGKKVETRGK